MCPGPVQKEGAAACSQFCSNHLALTHKQEKKEKEEEADLGGGMDM